jgi:hypothetical protein
MGYQPDKNRYRTMEYRRWQSGLRLPAISLGLWHNFGDTTLIENSRQLLQRVRSGHYAFRPCQQLWPAAGIGRT